MNCKLSLLLSGALLSAQSLLALTYNLDEDSLQISWLDAIGSYSMTEGVLISGPSSGMLVDSWVYIGDNLTSSNEVKVNQGALLKAEGNYFIQINKLTASNGNAYGQGTSEIVFKGNSSEEKLTLNISGTGTSGVGNDTNFGSSRIEFGGYTTLNITGGNSRFEVGYRSGFNGNADLLVTGSGNKLTINSFNSGDAKASGVAKITIAGSDNSVTANAAFRLIGAEGTSASDIRGAALVFEASEDGISALQIANPQSAGAVDISGVIVLDLSEFAFKAETENFQLISTSNSYALAEIESWLGLIEGGKDLFAVTGGDYEASDWQLSLQDDGLWVSVAAVPEPAACAAIFGALVLLLAAFRKNK